MIGFIAGLSGKVTTLIARLTADRATKLDNLNDTITSRAPASTALSTAQWSAARAGYLDNLALPIGRFRSLSATTSTSIVMDANTTLAWFSGVAPGAGGGAGGNTTATNCGAGGGGGAGEEAWRYPLFIPATGTIAITVGTQGAGATAGTAGTGGALFGAAGGDITVAVNGTTVLTLKGGRPGTGPGANSNQGGNGGGGEGLNGGTGWGASSTGAAQAFMGTAQMTLKGGASGGGGGHRGTSFNLAIAGALHSLGSNYTNNGTGQGGGGAWGPFGRGGTGGTISSAGSAGENAPSTSYGAGGGGGSARTSSGGGPAGGTGAPGWWGLEWVG